MMCENCGGLGYLPCPIHGTEFVEFYISTGFHICGRCADEGKGEASDLEVCDKCHGDKMTPELQEAINLAQEFVAAAKGRESREWKVCAALLSLHASERDTREKEWCIAWEWPSHPQDGTQRTAANSEVAAGQCIASLTEMPSNTRKQWRYVAGPWNNADKETPNA